MARRVVTTALMALLAGVAAPAALDAAEEKGAPARINVEDYKTAFGEEPPEVYQVAIMTDTDNTGSSAVADCDDIRFERRPEPD